MPMFVLTNARIFAGGADLTARSNKVELASQLEEKDVTTFASSGWKEVLGGLFSSALGGEGQWEAGDLGKVDDESWTNLGAVGAYTVCPNASVAGGGASVGDIAWLLQAMKANYKLGGQVGDIAPWTTAASGAWPLARGKVAHPPATPRTATGSGTSLQLTAVSATQYLYATLHVLSITGTAVPTITVKVQSSVDSAFTVPNDRITFTAATTLGGQIKRLVGPITDTWYRAQFTISGTTPSMVFVVALSVQ